MHNTCIASPSRHETAESIVIERLHGWLVRSDLLRLDDRKLVDALRDNFGTLRLLCNAALRDAAVAVELADIRSERAVGTSLVTLRLRNRASAAGASTLHRVPTSALRSSRPALRTVPDGSAPSASSEAEPASHGVPTGETATVLAFERPAANKRGRDHKGTYRRRNEAAVALGYVSYAQRRRARRTGEGLRPGDTPRT